MKRRTSLLCRYFHFTIALLALCSGGKFLEAATTMPNIVFVLFDDMGWGQPQSYDADSALRTPQLDKLATEGMRFTDAHSASAVCTPTRYGLLTGRYPFRLGQFGVLTTYSSPIIPSTRMTVASMLKQHGYITACIGKWHLGMNWVDGKPGQQNRLPIGAQATDGPNAVGFDYFYGFTHARNIGSIIEQDRAVANVQAVENQPLMIKQALQWLERRKQEEPFFLYFPMCPPHKPTVPAPEYVGKSGGKDLVRNEEGYADWVYQGDAMLGQIMDVLQRRGFADNTLLIAAADNGAANRPYEPLREAKTSIYEGGHRVPFIVRWPGKVQPGSTWSHTICLNDFMATIADILGAELPSDAAEDSISILPALLGNSNEPTREATVHQSHRGDVAIRHGEWKAIYHKDGRRELFNLDRDLSETTDVLQSNSKVANKLNSLFQSYIDRGRSTNGKIQKNEYKLSLEGGGQARKPKAARGKRK